MGLFFILFQFCSAFTFSAPTLVSFDESMIQKVANSKEWKGLLQYQKNFLGVERSEVDGKLFFLSEDGKTNPVSELKATLQNFNNKVVYDEKGESNDHPICHFPARLEYLKKHFNLSQLPNPNCAGLRVYKERIQNRKVSVVFSSYYAGSASSVFGHSFLKFSGTNENELFDTGINFAANPTTSNPILYSVYGLIGAFPATFSAQPFYYKVREYNDFESRDLWSYELNLSSDQKEMLISHLWEMGNTYYDYFYFNENCSYQILRVIEGALPEIRFFKSRPIYLIPSESIKNLYEIPNLVGEIRYRPSVRNVAYHDYSLLNINQKAELLHNLKNHNNISNDVEVQDALIDSIDLNYAEKIVKNDTEITEWKERLLQKRALSSRMNARPALDIPENEKPNLGHGSRRLSLGIDEQGINFNIRASHHDLLDPTYGYPRHLHIDFGRIGFHYLQESRRFLINDLTMVDLTALALEHDLYSKWSYQVKIGYLRRWTVDCEDSKNCGLMGIKAGVGKTYTFLKNHTFYTLLSAEPSYASRYHDAKFRINFQPSLSMLMEWEQHFKSQLQLATNYSLLSNAHWKNEVSLENRFVFSNTFGLNLFLSFEEQNNIQNKEFTLKGLYYF
jgi:hypothetical protein